MKNKLFNEIKEMIRNSSEEEKILRNDPVHFLNLMDNKFMRLINVRDSDNISKLPDYTFFFEKFGIENEYDYLYIIVNKINNEISNILIEIARLWILEGNSNKNVNQLLIDKAYKLRKKMLGRFMKKRFKTRFEKKLLKGYKRLRYK